MKKRFLSLIIALAMMVGVFTPLIASAADETTESVTLHKMLMKKDNLNIIGKKVTVNTAAEGEEENKETKLVTEKKEVVDNTEVTVYYVDGVKVEKADETANKFVVEYKKGNGSPVFKGQVGINGQAYDGNEITNITGYFGDGAKEIAGVYFAVKYKTGDNAGKFVTIKEGTQNEYGAVDSLDATIPTGFALLAGKTGTNGIKFNTKGLKGDFEIVEVHEKSSYIGKDGETLTDSKAVPVDITLPLINEEGVVVNAHVYPKNIEEKPDTNKDFTKEFTEKQPNGRTDEEKSAADPEDHNVGDVIGYTVTTKVPAKTKWKTAFWDDKMTEGLTFVTREEAKKATKETDKLYQKGLTVKYNDKEMDASWYELHETENGFTLKLTDTGFNNINDQENEAIIRIDYNAEVNEKAVVAIPESNDVTFHYGNHKDHGTTPVPNKPNDKGELTVTKNWDTGVAKKEVKFTLYDAQTGKKVEAKDVEAVEGYEFKNPVTITAGDTMTYTWKGLNKNIEYKVEEEYNGYSAEYTKGNAGQITVKNYNDENPEPINPTEPKVVTGGAKFVKTNPDGTERLAGAQFIVKKTITTDDGQKEVFLTGTNADRTAYNKAQEAFVNAVKAYNEAIKDGKTISADNKVKIGTVEYEKDADAKAAIAKLEKERDELWNATLKDMTQWEEKQDNAIKLTSNELGQFEIAGLEEGKYTLVEVKAPEGYALPANATFEFEIKKDGTQVTKDIDFGVKDDTAADNAQQVINKKVTIPQTGGIGTVIFTAIGLAIMASAIIAIKKRQATEAR